MSSRANHAQLGSRHHRSSPVQHDIAGVHERQVVSPHPRRRSVVSCLLATAALGLGFLVLTEIFQWDTHPQLVWAGLLLIFFGGAVFENAIRFGSMNEPPEYGTADEGRFTAGLPA